MNDHDADGCAVCGLDRLEHSQGGNNWPATLAGLSRDGYRPRAPTRDVAVHDAEAVALDHCPRCMGRLSYRPFTRERPRRPGALAATAYRAFAVCLRCGTANEY